MSSNPFISDDFLLQNETSRELYEKHAKDQPIVDYHCHLPPKDIAENRRFNNLHEVWLEGDHYKWRAMRTNGVPERLCTGDAEPYDKFMAWAKTVPHTLRNPLYHWTHLELKRYFGIDELLSEETGPDVWEQANQMLTTDELRVHGILDRFKVEALCTTDDPADDLSWHKKIAESDLATKVFPTFRPDKALAIDDVKNWNAWVDALGAAADVEINLFSDFKKALKKRHVFFHEMGCRLSDHGLERCYASFRGEKEASAIFDKVRGRLEPSFDECEKFATWLMVFFGRLDAEKGWTKQLHLGVMRNNNSRLFRELGPDTGFDSIGDMPQGRALSAYLDALDRDGALPKVILYNINPADNYLFATMLGNFQDGSVAGKLQLGSGWWFLDQKEAMEWQMNALSNLGLFSRFVGMLTDSRSFMSYPRHEYFRRVLCNLVGNDVEKGLIPDDDELLGPMIEGICYKNARDFFGLHSPPT